MPNLRLSLTISGAVALGAYEAGALAALLYSARPLVGGDDPPLCIDVMSGASAGSITALLAARTLLEGHDPRSVMFAAWVERDSLGAMLAHGGDAPLSIDALRSMGRELLEPARASPSSDRQSCEVQLSFALAALRGLEYRLPRLGRDPVSATTYIDFYNHVLHAGDAVDSLVTPQGASPLDAVLASAANAMGFPPYLLDRSAVWADYLEQGVDNLPPDPDRSLWYTDGGTLDNEPLGRTLDLANAADESAHDCQRLHVLIHPHPTAAIHDASWAKPTVQPTFIQTAVRAFDMQRTQSLYADLKQVEKTNTRISWLATLATELGATLSGLPEAVQAEVRAALGRALDTMAQDHAAIRVQRSDQPAPTPVATRGQPPDTTELLDEALNRAAGVGDKRPARVDVISPLLLEASKTHSVEELLSGEVLFHFGGFLDPELRRNDFDLGYASTLAWLTNGGLAAAGLPDELASRAMEEATTSYQPGEGWRQTGTTTVGSLLAMHPWQAARLTGRMTHVLVHDLVHHPHP